MKARSPVLGYNHNVRYAARMWHVQTEDSGVQAPHIYTHLFHDGTILASKKLEYDPTSDVTAVQKLMQAQHKRMMRELKSGTFDEKIEKYFGPIQRDPGDRADVSADISDTIPSGIPVDENGIPIQPSPPPTASAAPPPAASVPPAPPRPKTAEDDRPTVPDLGPLMPPPPAQPPTGTSTSRLRQASLTPARPAVAVTARAGSGTFPVSPPPTIGARSSSSIPRSAPPTIGSGRSGAAQANRPAAESVIVGRPTVIVGKDSGSKGDTADFWKTTERRQQPDPAFGGDLISEKSLDEVILAYLSEDAPKK